MYYLPWLFLLLWFSDFKEDTAVVRLVRMRALAYVGMVSLMALIPGSMSRADVSASKLSEEATVFLCGIKNLLEDVRDGSSKHFAERTEKAYGDVTTYREQVDKEVYALKRLLEEAEAKKKFKEEDVRTLKNAAEEIKRSNDREYERATKLMHNFREQREKAMEATRRALEKLQEKAMGKSSQGASVTLVDVCNGRKHPIATGTALKAALERWRDVKEKGITNCTVKSEWEGHVDEAVTRMIQLFESLAGVEKAAPNSLSHLALASAFRRGATNLDSLEKIVQDAKRAVQPGAVVSLLDRANLSLSKENTEGNSYVPWHEWLFNDTRTIVEATVAIVCLFICLKRNGVTKLAIEQEKHKWSYERNKLEIDVVCWRERLYNLENNLKYFKAREDYLKAKAAYLDKVAEELKRRADENNEPSDELKKDLAGDRKKRADELKKRLNELKERADELKKQSEETSEVMRLEQDMEKDVQFWRYWKGGMRNLANELQKQTEEKNDLRRWAEKQETWADGQEKDVEKWTDELMKDPEEENAEHENTHLVYDTVSVRLECPHCPKTYASFGCLKRHMLGKHPSEAESDANIAVDNVRLECPHGCGKTYSSVGCLKRHMLEMHQ
ncbi:unnamed protein product [Trypanosoma congolense IL3000]|uniref:WGS project CAEQ00000000 data, annotated contig 2404 n=1 Tax=Trypanosoma congolense (strain IL3000) TaxID=1068625 RepID=F9WDT7_TRYCI|nr:unnamed protein product [Trypanosoma congolense IL3000]